MASGSTTTTASNSSPLVSDGASTLAARSPTEERSGSVATTATDV